MLSTLEIRNSIPQNKAELAVFCSHKPEKYPGSEWLSIFSQWYNPGEYFMYEPSYLPGNLRLWFESFFMDHELERFKKLEFETREQWMMVMKCHLFGRTFYWNESRPTEVAFEYNDYTVHNAEVVERILAETDQQKVKEIGRGMHDGMQGFSPEREANCFLRKYHGVEICYLIVLVGNIMQFSQNESMKKILIEHDCCFVEGSDYDGRWGLYFNSEEISNAIANASGSTFSEVWANALELLEALPPKIGRDKKPIERKIGLNDLGSAIYATRQHLISK
jgi:hypothetical protein